jgi:hypothetical protein
MVLLFVGEIFILNDHTTEHAGMDVHKKTITIAETDRGEQLCYGEIP